jgi:hypothetical protein
MAREFLGIKGDVALKTVFTGAVYWSWGLLGLSIFSGVAFCFLSAKWARLAWGEPVSVLAVNASDLFIEGALMVFFWCTALGFLAGLALTLQFFVSYASK